jgi:hypothetical protein
MRIHRAYCNAVERGCKSPPGGGTIYPSARAECYRCGNAVCTNPACSKRIAYDGGRRRICWGCQDEIGRSTAPGNCPGCDLNLGEARGYKHNADCRRTKKGPKKASKRRPKFPEPVARRLQWGMCPHTDGNYCDACIGDH